MNELTEKEKAIMYLGLGGNIIEKLHYEILPDGGRSCIIQNEKGELLDFSQEMNHCFEVTCE